MKEAIRFFMIYSVVSILMLVLLQIVFHALSTEIFSYSIWLYIFYTGIGAVIFLLFGLLSSRYKLSFKANVICYAILCLLVLNSIPLVGEKKLLTFDTIKGLITQKIEFIDIWVHVIAILSFLIAYLVILRRNKFIQS